MKKISLIFLIVCSMAIAEEIEVQAENLKPISFENSIDILFVEEDYTGIKDIISTYPDKESYFYNYTMGKLYYNDGNKKEALNSFKKAMKFSNDDVSVNLKVLSIYLENKEYKNEAEKSISKLEKLNLTKTEKEQLNEIKKIFNEIYKLKYQMSAELGVCYDDNSDFVTLKNDETYSYQSLLYTASKELKKGNIKYQGTVNDRISFEDVENNSFTLSLGGEYTFPVGKYQLGIPLYLSSDSSRNNEMKLSTGINYSKELPFKRRLNSGLSTSFVNNLIYDGYEIGLYANYFMEKIVNYTFTTEIKTSIYDKTEYNSNKIILGVNAEKYIKKFYLFGYYKLNYELYNYEVSGEKRKDLIHNIKLGYEQRIYNEKLKYGLNYSFSYDYPNLEGYEANKNLVTALIKWDF